MGWTIYTYRCGIALQIRIPISYIGLVVQWEKETGLDNWVGTVVGCLEGILNRNLRRGPNRFFKGNLEKITSSRNNSEVERTVEHCEKWNLRVVGKEETRKDDTWRLIIKMLSVSSSPTGYLVQASVSTCHGHRTLLEVVSSCLCSPSHHFSKSYCTWSTEFDRIIKHTLFFSVGIMTQACNPWLRQEDNEFEARLGYSVRRYFQ